MKKNHPHVDAPNRVDPPAPSVSRNKQRYLGSVRFFKNLILLLVIVAIAIPTIFSIYFGHLLRQTEEDATAQLKQLGQEREVLQEKVTALEEYASTHHIDPEGPAYQELYPDFYAPQILSATTRQAGVIYLTFDDGPSQRTPEVLSVLRQENVKATFFVIGGDSEARRQWMRDIVNDGHTLAMHSYTHDYDDIYASVEDYLADMYQIFTMIKEATGVTPTHFRLPGGSINGYNYDVSQEILSEMLRRGFIPYDWNISSGDANAGGVSAQSIRSAVLNQASNVERGIVLMHDSGTKVSTVEALSSVISGLRDMGFTFDRLQVDTAPILFNYAY